MRRRKRKPFSTDGCSGGMSWVWFRLTGKHLPWHDCCVSHDKEYYDGGTPFDRWYADVKLRRCVEANANQQSGSLRLLYLMVAFLMYYGVRIGGHAYFPLPWRWDYGNKWPGRYRKRPDWD